MVYDGEKKRKYQRDWARNHRENINGYSKKLKRKAMDKLGGKCVSCGCNDYNALEFNHINGGGRKEREKDHSNCQKQMCRDILAGKRKDIDLRCRVCNAVHYLVQLKGLENKWKIIYGVH